MVADCWTIMGERGRRGLVDCPCEMVEDGTVPTTGSVMAHVNVDGQRDSVRCLG